MNSETVIKNAVIDSAVISNGDHGCLTATLYLDYGDSTAQSFGGWALYNGSQKVGVNACGVFINRCLDIAGVHEWSMLAGRNVRVRASFEKAVAIGHILKDDWFDPTEEFERLWNETKKD